jgi:hypothetical protein
MVFYERNKANLTANYVSLTALSFENKVRTRNHREQTGQ